MAEERAERNDRMWGFLWRPARDERTLAIFALSIVAIVVVLGAVGTTFAQLGDENPTSLSSEVMTIGSTAVGFIGGLLAGSQRTADLRRRVDRLESRADD